MIHQVQPGANYSFHPKFWLIKYKDAKGNAVYRIIVLSRNLTFDRSWDTALALEGKLTDQKQTRSGPLQDFLLYLAKQMPEKDVKREELHKLAEEINYVNFELNSREFRDFEFIPVGVPKAKGGKYSLENTNLFTKAFHDLLIMSPFLTASVIRNLTTAPCLKMPD